ncbi:nucleotidyltransferase family protein [Candidatus Omnitrophota bacterium]
MKALILAAGYGTRLYPYTKNFPKPLLEVGKRPIINYLVEKVTELQGVSGIIVVTNARFFRQFKEWKSSLRSKYPISIVNDLSRSPDDRLGAIGDMHFVFHKLRFSQDFLVLGGDNLFKSNLRGFMRFAKSKSPYASIGLFDIQDKSHAQHYGVVSLSSSKRVIDFYEKPAKPKSSLVAMCLYYFPGRTLSLLREYFNDPTNSSDASGSYISWLCKTDRVYGYIFKDFWFDVGHLDTYRKAKSMLREGR